MELIKKIKEAESRARDIVEEAKAESAKRALDGQKAESEKFLQAEQERRKIIEAACASGESEGKAEADKLKLEAEQRRGELQKKASGKIPAAVSKVLGYIKKG